MLRRFTLPSSRHLSFGVVAVNTSSSRCIFSNSTIVQKPQNKPISSATPLSKTAKEQQLKKKNQEGEREEDEQQEDAPGKRSAARFTPIQRVVISAVAAVVFSTLFNFFRYQQQERNKAEEAKIDFEMNLLLAEEMRESKAKAQQEQEEEEEEAALNKK